MDKNLGIGLKIQGGRNMDKASEIIKTAGISDLLYYIDYVEILLDIMDKRNLKDKNLEEEHVILTNRYNELIKEKKFRKS